MTTTSAVDLKLTLQAWLRATRPHTLTIGAIPVLVGTFLTPIPMGEIRWTPVLLALAISALLQISTHFINDVLDFNKGADTAHRLGPRKGIQLGLLLPSHVYLAGLACYGLILLLGVPLALEGGWGIWLLLLVSVLCSYCYTGGPYPLSYTGVADCFVLLFYGWACVLTTGYVQSGMLTRESFLAATQMGLLAIIPLAINNLRDYQGDAQAGKKTLAVRFGLTFARLEIGFVSIFPFVLGLFWLSIYPMAACLPYLLFPLALKMIRQICNHSPDATYNRYFKWGTILHALFGLLLILGYRSG